MKRVSGWALLSFLVMAGCSGDGSLLVVTLSAGGSVNVTSLELSVTASGRTRSFPIQVGSTIPPDFLVGIELPPDVSGTARASVDFNGESHAAEGVITPGKRTDVRILLDEATPPDLADSDLTGADLLPSWPDMAIDMSGPVLTSDVASFDFNSVLVNQRTAIATMRFRNFGAAPTASLVTTRGGSSATELEIVTDTCAGTALAPGGSCAIDVRFNPISAGQKTATLTLSGVSVTLTANAMTVNTSISITPTSQLFGATTVGTSSARQMVRVTNNTGSPIVIYTDTNTQDFVASYDTSVSPYCPVRYAVQLAGGTFCYAFVQSRPTIGGPIGGAYEIRQSSGTGTILAVESLVGQGGTGDGAAVITGFPTTGAFPATYFGKTSQPIDFVVSNSGGQYSGPIVIGVTGAPNQFQVTDNCSGLALHPGRSCLMRIAFKPTSAGGAGNKTLMLTATATPGNSVGITVAGVSGAFCTDQSCGATQYCELATQTCLDKKGPTENCTFAYECLNGSCSGDNECN